MDKAEKMERAAAAQRNRDRMPRTAAIVDEFREVFGADAFKVVFAHENGIEVGAPGHFTRDELQGKTANRRIET